MKVGIIRYPGSNCDNDMLRYFDDTVYIWHKEIELPHDIDLLVIPGGFAFGDRYYKNATSNYVISPGTMALESPVTKAIGEAVERKIPILGVCNGFQILTQLNLLPGKLFLNENKQFTCKKVQCILHSVNDTPLELHVANSYGNYSVTAKEYESLVSNNQIFLTYANSETYTTENGSFHNIAGVCDKNHMIYGMMPHPERSNDTRIRDFFSEIVNQSKLIRFLRDSYFKERVNSLMKSEHISYKSTRKYLKRLYTKGEHVVQGPGENAGIIDIGDGYCLALRIESHNHPVFIDPYQGAATGVGGIMRDIFTMGARPIAIFDFLRFGIDSNSDKLLTKTIKGISDYGNCFGVANLGGDLYRSEIYNKNPLVNIACIGIVKKENIVYGNALEDGSIMIYVGSKTGNDGVNGACMASSEFSEDTDIESLKSSIQKGDPFLEKLLLEACCEISEMNILEGMQDMGAGGLLCSSLELIQRGREKTGKNLGCVIDVNCVPVKYEMDDCDKMISESQERMLLVVKKEHKTKIFDVFEKWDLEYSVVGTVNTTGCYTVQKNKHVLYEEPIDNFTDITEDWEENCLTGCTKSVVKNDNDKLWEQYDTTIGGRTLNGPLDPGSYSILDIYENNTKILVTWGENIEECLKHVSDFKAKPQAVVNCLNFGNPIDTMGDFAKTIDNLRESCEQLKIPVVGGNVSLYNATDNISIKPTPILLMVSILE